MSTNVVVAMVQGVPAGEFFGHRGQRIDPWHEDFIEMRSTLELRTLIRGGFETAACWAELKRRAERVRAARSAIASLEEASG